MWARGDVVQMFTSRLKLGRVFYNDLVFDWMEKIWRGAELKGGTVKRMRDNKYTIILNIVL